MAQQTFLIEINADRKHEQGQPYYDFFRVSCKTKETALKYLKNWKRQAIREGLQKLYKCFFVEDAKYQIIATPDGYHEAGVVLSGMMEEL